MSKEKLLYDLAMNCAVLEVQRNKDNTKPISTQLLDAFDNALLGLKAQDGSKINEVLKDCADLGI